MHVHKATKNVCSYVDKSTEKYPFTVHLVNRAIGFAINDDSALDNHVIKPDQIF